MGREDSMSGAIASTNGTVGRQQQGKQPVEIGQPAREGNRLALEGVAQILDPGRTLDTISHRQRSERGIQFQSLRHEFEGMTMCVTATSEEHTSELQSLRHL